jgi:hypothetical protein
VRLERYRHLWGVTESLEVAVPRFKAFGYDGIEAWLPDASRRDELKALLEAHNMPLISQIITRVNSRDHSVDAHLENLKRQVDFVLPLAPKLLNMQPGFDAWTESETMRFCESALEFATELPVPLAFETHRGCITFSPWSTLRLLEAFPDLRLVLDLSHWVVVCERLLDDQQAILERAANACVHLHARVGFEQGPQVPDPRAPEYAAHLAAHERWWRMVWAAQEARGDLVSTLTPEFGPHDYLPHLPFTQVPVTDLPTICDWMANRQREQFQSRTAV